MVDRKKKIKTRDKGSREEDWFSKLPDVLICDKILIHLSTEDSVRTSVLSTKWRNLWKWVPVLDLSPCSFSSYLHCNSSKYDAFVSFIDKFLDFQRESWIRKLKLIIFGSDGTKTYRSSWVDAVTKRKIQQLDVCFYSWVDRQNEIPMSIFTCETLVQLGLSSVTLVNAEFVSLPCLKIMYLGSVKYLNEATIEKMISGSPILEDLTITGFSSDNENVIKVHSQMLKRIRIDRFIKVEIDAPLLQFFKTDISEEKNFKIISSDFPDKVHIDVFGHLDPSNISQRVVIRDVLTDISKARELVIGDDLLKGIFLYSKLEPLLQFPYLSRLDAKYYKSDMELLPTLLESCPNLESLALELSLFSNRRKEKEPNVMFSTVPRCLVSSLKFVELKRSKAISKYEGEMELVRYLLKNSTVLEKLRLDNCYRKKEKCDIRTKLLAMPRGSSICELLVL